MERTEEEEIEIIKSVHDSINNLGIQKLKKEMGSLMPIWKCLVMFWNRQKKPMQGVRRGSVIRCSAFRLRLKIIF